MKTITLHSIVRHHAQLFAHFADMALYNLAMLRASRRPARTPRGRTALTPPWQLGHLRLFTPGLIDLSVPGGQAGERRFIEYALREDSDITYLPMEFLARVAAGFEIFNESAPASSHETHTSEMMLDPLLAETAALSTWLHHYLERTAALLSDADEPPLSAPEEKEATERWEADRTRLASLAGDAATALLRHHPAPWEGLPEIFFVPEDAATSLNGIWMNRELAAALRSTATATALTA